MFLVSKMIMNVLYSRLGKTAVNSNNPSEAEIFASDLLQSFRARQLIHHLNNIDFFSFRSFFKNNQSSATTVEADRTKNDEAIKSLRDVIAFCTIPPRPPEGASGLSRQSLFSYHCCVACRWLLSVQELFNFYVICCMISIRRNILSRRGASKTRLSCNEAESKFTVSEGCSH